MQTRTTQISRSKLYYFYKEEDHTSQQSFKVETPNNQAGRSMAALRWATFGFLLFYLVLPTLVLLLFREPEITGTICEHAGVALGSLAGTFLGTRRRGWNGFVPCMAIGFGALKYGMDGRLWYPPASETQLLAGKVAVVTGGNSGLGLATAKALATMGAHVVLTCRSAKRCRAAVKEVNSAALGGGGVGSAEFAMLRLDSLSSAFDLANQLSRKHPRIHYLFNNAGSTPRYNLTDEGLEDGFGGMHLAHVAVTLGLLPSLRRAGEEKSRMGGQSSSSRVIMTSSEIGVSAACGHFGSPPFHPSLMEQDGEGDLRGEATRGDGTLIGSLSAYGRAKLSNDLFAFELNRKFRERGWPVTSYALHTGAVRTKSSAEGLAGAFRRAAPVLPGLGSLARGVLMPLLWRSPEEGSRVLLYAALANDPPSMARGGQYVDGLGRPALDDEKSERMKCIREADAMWSSRLWDVSMRLLSEGPAKGFVRRAP